MGWEGIGRGEEEGGGSFCWTGNIGEKGSGGEQQRCMVTVGSSAAKGSWGDQKDGIRDPTSILDPAMDNWIGGGQAPEARLCVFLAVFGVGARGQGPRLDCGKLD